MKFHRHSYSSCIASVLITITIFVSLSIDSSPAFAQCKPLLILIKGGGGGKTGGGIQTLADYFRKTYSGDIQINVMDNDQFWFLFNFRENNFNYQANIISEQINRGRHFPIVIIGHSMGGYVAARFATRIPTDLLLTLDPVSYAQPKNVKPQWAKHWIHIYLRGDALGIPDWQHQNSADRNIHLHTDHFDVINMYNQVSGTVDAYLRCRR